LPKFKKVKNACDFSGHGFLRNPMKTAFTWAPTVKTSVALVATVALPVSTKVVIVVPGILPVNTGSAPVDTVFKSHIYKYGFCSYKHHKCSYKSRGCNHKSDECREYFEDDEVSLY